MSPGTLILRLARSKWCAACLTRLLTVLLTLQHACRQLCACIYNAPLVACVIASAVLVLASLILLFNICLARLFTIPGAILLNAGLLWCLLRLAVRAIAFPGSIVLWKRSTEAMWRVEMAKQWAYQLEQLLAFLRAATGRTQGVTPGASLEGAVTGCALVEGLARNLRAQQRDKVHFTQEQARMRLLVTGVETWLHEAKVCDRRGGKAEVQVPLVDWLQRMSQSIVPVPFNYAVASAPLVRESQAEAGACIDRLEQLAVLFDGLHRQEDGCCASTRRFLRVPTVGSLHQMRAELLVRYSGNHCWVRTPDGRKIDGMFIAAHGSEGGSLSSEVSPKDDALAGSNNKEDVPLKEVVAESSNANPGAVVVWCNPNAGYYETMAYESHWLDFYLSQGCSVFLFNYGGFGRSQGNTTTSTVAADGNAVVEFLKRRGFTDIGVHGRSIGGIAACNIAQAHADTIKFLCADRTFSSLARVAKFGFGEWAVKALGLSATWADNLGPYLQARCYKVLICDPKDATVPDIASLRTGVAMDTVLQVPPADRLAFGEDKIHRLAEAWAFFDTLIGIIDRDEPVPDGIACTMSCCQAKRPARQPIVGKPQVEPEARVELDEEDTQRLVGSWPRGEVRKSSVDIRWLEEHGEVVQSVMTTHIEALRLALEVVGSQLNAGTTLDDTLSRGGLEEARESLRCFLANIQVWGSLNPAREPLSPSTADSDADFFLSRRPDLPETQDDLARLAKVLASLTPDRLAAHQRQTSRSLVAHVRRLFRQHLSALRRSLEPLARDDGAPASALCAAVLLRLREIEGFMTTLYRFFKCVDVAGSATGVPPLLPPGVPPPPCEIIPGVPTEVATSDDSEESRDPANSRTLRPTLDRSVTGYLVCIDCGHNGVLSEPELRHLALHLRAAHLGRHRGLGDKDPGV
mmetsp:Transcript_38161/g.110185  ORF Transcript_38161/g.110185 Transcript_38161/m.110185 type:complete len:917 (-) Transcript_38161:97-2847(-)